MSAAEEMKSVRELVSAEEWALRVDLAATYRLVAMYGWDDMIFTHISVRVPGPEHHFLINPYGMLFEEITASSLVKIDLEGNIVMDSPYFVNPAGFTIHSAIHAAREDAQCVLHVHTDDGVAVSAQKNGLLPISQTSMLVRSNLAYHDYEGVALNLDERERLVNDIGDKNLMMLRNHGTLSVGQTCGLAFIGIYFLERSCTSQVRAQVAELNLPSQAALDTVDAQASSLFQPGIDGLAWPALLRKLDRLDPSFRD
ncbi:class II aldolase/adducin family protein [Alphaproteobacteria bacterium]|nr:class II aldolase/adducin family protein [bacterium]MDC0147361.1 class II aldolase/adducin family protein [Alphaproteobacteria bacterium]